MYWLFAVILQCLSYRHLTIIGVKYESNPFTLILKWWRAIWRSASTNLIGFLDQIQVRVRSGQVRLLNSLTLRATRATMNAKSKRKNNKSDATGPKNGTRRKRFMRLLMLLRRSATGGAIWWWSLWFCVGPITVQHLAESLLKLVEKDNQSIFGIFAREHVDDFAVLIILPTARRMNKHRYPWLNGARFAGMSLCKSIYR